MTPTQIGILKDIKAGRVDLDEIGDWMREQLAQIIFHGCPILIETQGPHVYLTEAGERYLAECLKPTLKDDADSTTANPINGLRFG